MAKCTASAKSTGKPCRRDAIMGGTVCMVHGGGAPQVRAAARMRLLALVDPALAVMAVNLKNRKDNPQVAQRAAEDILDRAGIGPPSEQDRLAETAQLQPAGPRYDYSCLSDEQVRQLVEIQKVLEEHRKNIATENA